MKRIFFALVLMALLTANNIYAQQSTTPSSSKHMLREDSAAVNALVLYPDTIRLDIFEACLYPASIVSIATLQKNTSADFNELINSYSKDDQEALWNLSRYPSLVSSLVQGGKKSKDEINAILADYPQDIHKDALDHGRSDYDVLQKMDALQSNTNKQFEQILTDYPPVTQEALRELIQFPEIINILNDHLSLVVRAGDHYRRDPQAVIHRADSMNEAAVRQNAENAEAWKDSLQQNPEQENDLKNAAEDYAKENGYSDDEIHAAPDPGYVNNYYCAPYSYWFGYPTWYPYSYWYPYPFWFDCGFYYDPFGHIVIIGTPSYYFTNWYFYYPSHWNHYPHLGNAYINHYYGPRRTVSSNTLVVRQWVHNNRNYLPENFVATNPRSRVEAIRQVGQMHQDVQRQTGSRAVTPAARTEYLKNNASKYPSLRATPQAQPEVRENRQATPAVIQQPEKQPPVRLAKPAETQAPAQAPRQESRPQPQPQQQQRQPSYDFNRINKAQDYHRNVWEQTAPRQEQQPVQHAQPQQQAPRQQQPMQAQPQRQAPVSHPAAVRK